MKRLRRVAGAALMAAAAIGLSTGVGAAQTDDSTPNPSHPTWQLRAQVRGRPGVPLSGPGSLPEAIDAVHRAACGAARGLLGDGDPARTRVVLALWGQPGPTGPTDVGSPEMSCHVGPERVSAFHIRGLVEGVTGWLGPSEVLRRVAGIADNQAERVLATGEKATITLALRGREKPIRGMIRSLAQRHGVSVSTALRVAACESGFNPRAHNPAGPYVGIYQQDAGGWPGRARRYGHPGASPFDAYANIDVSLKMARSEGWGHWGCA